MRVLLRIIISTNFWGQGGTPCEIPFGSAKCSIELQHVSNMLGFVRESQCTTLDNPENGSFFAICGDFLTYKCIGGVQHEKTNYDISA